MSEGESCRFDIEGSVSEEEKSLIKKIFDETKVIAVAGLSPKPERASHWVSAYLQKRGFRIIPVYPRENEILGEKVYKNMEDIKEKVDTVLIFRRSDMVLPVVETALKIGPKFIWMQEGIINNEAAELAESRGVEVIMDRCMYQEGIKMDKGEKV